ncbi:hypothetical protein H8B02_06870 [Bradyrhizobium sp. Pear77]|nr:hypothetical protein [Bradyrhizobium altum]MCC8953201.1 hypothetical protein [Bradyrhizobium altum]
MLVLEQLQPRDCALQFGLRIASRLGARRATHGASEFDFGSATRMLIPDQ